MTITINHNYTAREGLECCSTCLHLRHQMGYEDNQTTHWCWEMETQVSPTGLCDAREAK